ncbi:hypothetical protein HJD18_12200 [Thermoleophilia bacterium SCSIO 60948]|nr:hypothetical protein HJD18_12200 [Thermoleophilia bacterium SCSIO 60948]
MAPFRDRSDIELDAFTEEELLTQMRAAREHGDGAAERRARDVLAWKVGTRLEPRLRLRLKGESESAIEQIRDAIIDSLLKAEYAGETIGEVRSFANTVFERRVADHYRRKRLRTTELAEENLDEEEGPVGAVLLEESESGAVEVQMVADDVLAARNPIHVRVVNLYLQGRPSKEIARIVNDEHEDELGSPMTAANVDQITRRFRRDIADAMGGGA